MRLFGNPTIPLQAASLLAAMLLMAATIGAKEKAPHGQFRYAGGTEKLADGCEGNLELGTESMNFKCKDNVVSIPYGAITLMQYRYNVSKKVQKMKVKWVTRPFDVLPPIRGKDNRYFTVVYQDAGPHIVILRVRPDAMRPYLAELDLRAQKHVEVQSYEP